MFIIHSQWFTQYQIKSMTFSRENIYKHILILIRKIIQDGTWLNHYNFKRKIKKILLIPLILLIL